MKLPSQEICTDPEEASAAFSDPQPSLLRYARCLVATTAHPNHYKSVAALSIIFILEFQWARLSQAVMSDPAQTKTRIGKLPGALSSPARWFGTYEDFIAKNANAVAQIESGLRSLAYIIPGKLAKGKE